MFQTVNHAVSVAPMCFLLGGLATAKPSSTALKIQKVVRGSADVFRRAGSARALSQANAQPCLLLQVSSAHRGGRFWCALKGLIQQRGR